MTIYHNSVDPYTREERRFECVGCGHRFERDERTASCPECGGQELRNLAVPQE